MAMNDLLRDIAKRKRERDGEADDEADDTEGADAEEMGGDEMAADDEGGEESYSSVGDDAASELAELAGVPAEKVGAFKAALKQYVQACMNDTPEEAAEGDEE